MKRKTIIKRYILFIISLFFTALGVAIMKKGNLGISPTSSVANVMSIKFDFISMGNWLIIWNSLLILCQIILLRKNFKLIQLLQIPISIMFGYFTDFAMWLVSPIGNLNYFGRIMMIILGMIVLSFGVCLSVIANVVMNSGEAFVKAISDTIKKDFGTVKTFVDVSYVCLALILSLIFFNFKIIGVREGTIIVALFTGLIVKFYIKYLKKRLNFILDK